MFARLFSAALQLVEAKGLWPHFATTSVSAILPLAEPKGLLAQYAFSITDVLERLSVLTVTGTAVVESPVLFPVDSRCLYRDCNSTSFVIVPGDSGLPTWASMQ